jgi:hypothetical protein
MTYDLTIRAKHPDVTEIPPIELPYFDARTGKYSVAKSKPIPIKVRATKVVTANDAQGRDLQDGSSGGKELETVSQGISHNYSARECLQGAGNVAAASFFATIAGVSVLTVPPGVWLIALIGAGVIRKRLADPAGVKAKQAFGKLTTELTSVNSHDALLEAAKRYLGATLRLAPGALTFADVNNKLTDAGVGADTIGKLKGIFEKGDAARFAGGGSGSDLTDDLKDLRDAVAELEKRRIGR